MDISVNKLNVAYALSTWKSSDSPAVLKKVSHLVGLFLTRSRRRGARLRKAEKKGNNAKDLFVKIRDLNDVKVVKSKGAAKKSKVSLVHRNVPSRAAVNRGSHLGKEGEDSQQSRETRMQRRTAATRAAARTSPSQSKTQLLGPSS